MKTLLLTLFVFITIGCSQQQPPPLPTNELRQTVLEYLEKQPVITQTRYTVKGMKMEYQKENFYLVSADIDVNGNVSNRKFIGQKIENGNQSFWQVVPATETNLKAAGIDKPKEK